MRLIWATRGRTWGFRFLIDGGFSDPLPEYSKAFANFDATREFAHRAGDMAALRFEDPLRREDRAGRVIPHDFVVFGEPAQGIRSVAAGLDLVWPAVQDEYARIYDLADPTPPAA